MPVQDARCPSALLEALAAQTVSGADFEVVVVDVYSRAAADSSVREAVARAAAHLRVTLIEQLGASRAAGANRGLRAARALIVLLLASDFVPTPGLLAAHLALHEARRDPSVCGLAVRRRHGGRLPARRAGAPRARPHDGGARRGHAAGGRVDAHLRARHPGSYWWQRAAGRPDLAYLAVERLAWLRAAMTRRESARGSYFTWAMERHFARGYRQARAATAPRA